MEDLFDVKIAVGMQGVKQELTEKTVGELLDQRFRQPLEELQQLALASQFHELQHDPQAGVAFLGGRIALGQIEQGVLELRQEGQEIGGEFVRQIKQILEGTGDVPGIRPLVQHDGQDRWQRHPMCLVVLDEDFHDVT